MRLRYGENFAGAHAGRSATARASKLGGVDASASIRPATCSARPRSASNARACASSPRATTRRRRSDLRAIRADPVRRLHHRSDLRPAGVPPSDAGRRDRQAAALGRAVSGARPSGRRLCARQGAARDRAAAQRRLRQADLPPRRDGERSRATTRARGIDLGELAAGARRQEGRLRRRTSCSARRRRHAATAGRGAFPIRSPHSRRAGCACAHARASAASSCRWSSPIMPTGTT